MNDANGRKSSAEENPDVPIACTLSPQEAKGLRTGTRTPRPYHHDQIDDWQGRKYARYQTEASNNGSGGEQSEQAGAERGQWQRQSKPVSVMSSESGTEADDERPPFVKALPSSTVRPRKGLKTGEKDEDALLTPSQLDERERELSGYFQKQQIDGSPAEKEREEHEKLMKRRYAEFARRSSEVVLMAIILVVVLCGRGVARIAWEWRRELLSQVVTIIGLIVVYPVKLSIIDTAAAPASIWQRFRVPASFDPATVLYPPLLPIMVALSVAPANAAVVLPNIILGLASLPQRLFPRSSRLGRFNSMHWLVAIVPLIVFEILGHSAESLATSAQPRGTAPALSRETLVTLYPLHHALLQPLQYLTTTSLLISEVHLLSAVLINLLLLAASPQQVILKACLWLGGVLLFVSCGPVLHWNLTLARIPRWKLRRDGHTAQERKSLVDAVSDLISLQRAANAFNGPGTAESDADEDEPSRSIKHKSSVGRPRLNTSQSLLHPLNTGIFGPRSAADAQDTSSILSSDADSRRFTRRNTLPERGPPEVIQRTTSTKRSKSRARQIAWYLQITPEQAKRRKWLYAAFVYLAILAIVFVPVSSYIDERALYNCEPVGWALSYLFGQIPIVYSTIQNLGLDTWWIPLPPANSTDWSTIPLSMPLHVDLIRADLGQANVRLLLIAYWLAVLGAGLLTVFTLTAFVEVDTRRKVFHGVMVAMLLPATYVDPCFCSLTLALILAVFLLLEVIRAGQVPPLGNALSRFVAPYVDGRDLRGPVVVSHIFLLIGCAVPLWFSLASIERDGAAPWEGWELEHNRRETAMIAGVVSVGMGDAAASLIGRRYGRRKWIWVGGKSLEGSAAMAIAVAIGLLTARAWQVFGGWNGNPYVDRVALDWTSFMTWGSFWEWSFAIVKALFCGMAASFMEAVLTGANDNVVVPVALWLLVKGVRL
ncbi:putative polyprenol kinase family [Septoria linicola]|nr:putative polyprenol kinase family [Septoria linicola]